MAIIITGDTHGDFRHRFNTANFPMQRNMTKEDYVIICGDFGGIWEPEGESKEEKYWLDWFESRSYTLLFCDGNHENFDRLNEYPIEEWKGGKVHRIRPHVLHLMRGQVFNINGTKIFTFGGARSQDIAGGILEKSSPTFADDEEYLFDSCIPFRVNHESWWKEEMPSEEEMKEGLKNLAKNDFKVDYILTHDCPLSVLQEIQKMMGGYEMNELNGYLQLIDNKVEYKRWYCGHYHSSKQIDSKHSLLYLMMVVVGDAVTDHYTLPEG